jgi:hypothetical protein
MKDHCPRCLSPWDRKGNTDYCLVKCGMQRPHDEADRLLYILENIIKKEDFLVWYTSNKYCCYFRSLRDKSIKLPYLKFDIEADKLKLYLTFS